MSTWNASVKSGTMTTPPPSPVSEPRNPAAIDPRKMIQVSSSVFMGVSFRMAVAGARDGFQRDGSFAKRSGPDHDTDSFRLFRRGVALVDGLDDLGTALFGGDGKLVFDFRNLG